jgi:hypothetical protein
MGADNKGKSWVSPRTCSIDITSVSCFRRAKVPAEGDKVRAEEWWLLVPVGINNGWTSSQLLQPRRNRESPCAVNDQTSQTLSISLGFLSLKYWIRDSDVNGHPLTQGCPGMPVVFRLSANRLIFRLCVDKLEAKSW